MATFLQTLTYLWLREYEWNRQGKRVTRFGGTSAPSGELRPLVKIWCFLCCSNILGLHCVLRWILVENNMRLHIFLTCFLNETVTFINWIYWQKNCTELRQILYLPHHLWVKGHRICTNIALAVVVVGFRPNPNRVCVFISLHKFTASF